MTTTPPKHAPDNLADSPTVHRGYWEAAQELYEKLPRVGSLMRR